MRRIVCILIVLAFSLFACTTAPTQNAPTLDEHVTQIGERLVSVPATNLYSISQMYWSGSPGGWLANGVTFCDIGTNDRCINEPTASQSYHSHGLLKFDLANVSCPVLVKATLALTTRTYDGTPKNLELRRVLKDWAAPAMPCSSNGVQSSATVGWSYAKSDTLWSVPGAWGIGSDVSTDLITKAIPDGIAAQAIDVTSLVTGWFDGSAPNYGLWLASRDDADLTHGKHIGVIPSMWALALECTDATNPPDAGTGGVGGATTTSTTSMGGSTATTSTSTTSTTSTSTSSTSTSTCTCTCQ